MYKKIFSLFLLAGMILLTSCSGDSGSLESGEQNSDTFDSNNLNFVTKPIEYSFPEFLLDTEDISIFSRQIYSNMDNCNVAVSSDDQPLVGYYVDLSFSGGKLYRYRYNGLYGVVDSEGNEKLEPLYTSVVQLRPDLLELVREGETLYASIDAEYNISLVEDDSFDWIFEKNQITVIRTIQQTDVADADGGNTAAKYTLKTADGGYIYQQSFDSVAELVRDDYDFDCEQIYNAYLSGANYLIVIDKYYNYRVYEGDYATVEVSVGENTGSCYVLSYDHFVEISSLTDSFKMTESREDSQKEGDYVKITFGDSELSEVLVIYSDGYTEQSLFNAELNEMVTSYYKVDREAFADVVDWITRVLSTEYVTEEE